MKSVVVEKGQKVTILSSPMSSGIVVGYEQLNFDGFVSEVLEFDSISESSNIGRLIIKCGDQRLYVFFHNVLPYGIFDNAKCRTLDSFCDSNQLLVRILLTQGFMLSDYAQLVEYNGITYIRLGNTTVNDKYLK